MTSHQVLFDLIGALARKRLQAAERGFWRLGLNHTEARLLTLLDQHGGSLGQESLSQMIHIDRSNAGRALKKLEAEGYVARQVDPSDKRANVVAITDKGMTMVEEIRAVRREIANGFFGNLTEDDAKQIVELLGKAGLA